MGVKIVILLACFGAFVHGEDGATAAAPQNASSTTGGTPAPTTSAAPLIIEGTNICGAGNGSCFCDFNVPRPIIDCQAKGMHLMYEQTDWSTTFAVLNLNESIPFDLKYSDNELINLPVFPPLPILNLILTRNKISEIEDRAFTELNRLEFLDLGYNNLESEDLHEQVFLGKHNGSEGGYLPLPIVHLNLTHNKIHSLDKNAFDHLINLHTLDLSFNPLKTLMGTSNIAISTLRKLQYLNLAFTQISDMHQGMLHDLIQLSALDLSGNNFVIVPNELSFTHKLTVLNLDNNKFETLDKKSFAGLDNLQDLSLTNNVRLRSVESETFGMLISLEKLDLSFCKKLETLSDGAFQGLVIQANQSEWKLLDIRLNDNGLSNIDEALLNWTLVDYIDIQNNPFRCDCNLEWMANTLVAKIGKIKPSLTNDITCAQPKSMRGKSLAELSKVPDLFSRCKESKDELNSEDISLNPSGYRAAGITILVIGILLIVIGISAVAFLFIKRRAIAKALVNHQEIRYERADSDDDGIGSINSKTRRF